MKNYIIVFITALFLLLILLPIIIIGIRIIGTALSIQTYVTFLLVWVIVGSVVLVLITAYFNKELAAGIIEKISEIFNKRG